MKNFLSGFVFLLLQQQLTGKYKIVARGEEWYDEEDKEYGLQLLCNAEEWRFACYYLLGFMIYGLVLNSSLLDCRNVSRTPEG